MENWITIRFFKVHTTNSADPTLDVLINNIDKIQPPSQRESELGQFLRVRLERTSVAGSYISGEVTRIQSQNMPSEVHPNETKPLSVTTPLGHGIAFVYNKSKNVLAIQYDTRILGPSRFMDYLFAKGGNSSASLKPILRQDAWERFNKGEPKKFEITVAPPDNFNVLDYDGEAVLRSIKAMAEAHKAATVTISVSVGRSRKNHLQNIRKTINSLFEAGTSGKLNVQKMKAVMENEDRSHDRHIDFLHELLSKREKLDLPENDPDLSYNRRNSAIRAAMTERGY